MLLINIVLKEIQQFDSALREQHRWLQRLKAEEMVGRYDGWDGGVHYVCIYGKIVTLLNPGRYVCVCSLGCLK